MRKTLGVSVVLFLLGLQIATAAVSLPPSGDNQRAMVTQFIGPVKISIDYSSPRIHNPYTNEDRRGKIWGALVPYGLAKNTSGYGDCQECPWRAGANENTVFTVSDDVKIEGQTLPAGTYGLFMIPGETEWTLIFSKDHEHWGHFWYNPANDVLRVKVKPEKSEYHEYLTYEFPVRATDHATAELRWEELAVPFNITFDDINQIYLSHLRKELKSDPGFDWPNSVKAARFALQHKSKEDALAWARSASAAPFPGAVNFDTLSTLADAEDANGMSEEARKTRQQALNDPSATAIDLHLYARSLLAQGRKEDALAVFEQNAKKHPNAWPVNAGLARGYSAVGRYQDALKYAKLAIPQAPDNANRQFLESAVKKLEQNQDIN